MAELEILMERVGHTFKDRELLETALTHSSYANENRDYHTSGRRVVCNERLEFLGDSVLSMITTDYLYKNRSSSPEGELTKLRAAVVCEAALHEVALAVSLGDFLFLGKGEEQNGGRTRTSILADAVEAVLAAVYLDGGLKAARGFILQFLPKMIETAERGVLNSDYKTRLQEIVQRSREETISYVPTGRDGPDHDAKFKVVVYINSNPFAEGVGHSKKEAEQEAARAALELMGL